TVNMTGSSGGTVSFSSNSVILADVEANIAPGTAPAKQAVTGGVYNSTPPMLSNTQTAAMQLNASGQHIVTDPNLEMGLAAGTAPSKAVAVGAQYISGGVTLSTTQTAALQANSTGQLIVTDPNLEMGLANGTAPSKAVAVGGQYNSSPLTLSTTQTSALQVDATGALYVNAHTDSIVPADPCQSRNVAKSSFLSNISSATTTPLVAV